MKKVNMPMKKGKLVNKYGHDPKKQPQAMDGMKEELQARQLQTHESSEKIYRDIKKVNHKVAEDFRQAAKARAMKKFKAKK